MKVIKKILLGIGAAVGVVAGFLLIWNVVLPVIGNVLSNLFGLFS